jgi:hypothetical protein
MTTNDGVTPIHRALEKSEAIALLRRQLPRGEVVDVGLAEMPAAYGHWHAERNLETREVVHKIRIAKDIEKSSGLTGDRLADFVEVVLRHEAYHARHTSRDPHIVHKAIDQHQVSPVLYNLFEDARIEAAGRRNERGRPFDHAGFHLKGTTAQNEHLNVVSYFQALTHSDAGAAGPVWVGSPYVRWRGETLATAALIKRFHTRAQDCRSTYDLWPIMVEFIGAFKAAQPAPPPDNPQPQQPKGKGDKKGGEKGEATEKEDDYRSKDYGDDDDYGECAGGGDDGGDEGDDGAEEGNEGAGVVYHECVRGAEPTPHGSTGPDGKPAGFPASDPPSLSAGNRTKECTHAEKEALSFYQQNHLTWKNSTARRAEPTAPKWETPDLSNVQAIARMFEKLIGQRDAARYITSTSGRRVHLRGAIVGAQQSFKRPLLKSGKRRIALIMDMSGSMNSRFTKHGAAFLAALHILRNKGVIDADIYLTGGGRHAVFPAGISLSALDTMAAAKGTETFAATLKAITPVLRKADTVLCYTDGMLTDGDVNAGQYRAQGIDLIGCAVAPPGTNIPLALATHFGATVVAESGVLLAAKLLQHILKTDIR